jgi:hypothetical protein
MRKFSQIVISLDKAALAAAQASNEFENLGFYMSRESGQEGDLTKAFSKGYMLGIPEVEGQPYLETLVEVLIGTLSQAVRNLPKSDCPGEHRKRSTINRDLMFTLGHITDTLEYMLNCSSFHSDTFYDYDRQEIARKLRRFTK